ncbi:hypothetical protein FOMPIDRAFT_88509 [Fomitopsis schrenkii]|uniref:Uncharacterized protein n=1 Tax=Fomitopsis schrenkii TaxID=2126942 RepID=S8EZE6_FOMSC|nr:hypothetical protein FOMPIDRAFT_88509 [Fomitopsis schrenkii]
MFFRSFSLKLNDDEYVSRTAGAHKEASKPIVNSSLQEYDADTPPMPIPGLQHDFLSKRYTPT